MAEGSRPDQRSDVHVQRSGSHGQLWAGNTSKHHCSACARYEQLELCECVLMPINQIYVYTVCDGQNSTQSSHKKQSPKTFICRFRYYTKLAVSGKHKAGKQQAWSQATDLLLFLTVDVSPVLPMHRLHFNIMSMSFYLIKSE